MMMKKNLFLAALAIVALASCTDSEFVGDNSPDNNPTANEKAIVFNTSKGAVTRGDLTGQEAAKALDYAFVIGGFKGSSSVTSTDGAKVFDNYNVVYPETHSTSNSSGWEYEGLTKNANSIITGAQTIKYWDYSQDQYDFIAYSLGNGNSGSKATVTTITPSTATDDGAAGAYKLTGTLAQLKTVHIADLKTVAKSAYDQPVQLSFRSLVSKVRIGLYENIPGYSVKNVTFYTAADDGSPSATSALYASTSTLPTAGTYTVYFPTVNNETPASDKNKAHVALSLPTNASYLTFGAITGNYGTAERAEEAGEYYLGRQSDQRTWTGTNTDGELYYTEVLPYETGVALTLKVNYTLVSIDGSGENINVVGATAVVPAIYTQWKPGYAYTYIFKISDNTNGYTSGTFGTDAVGLHPITFDAVVVQSEEHQQETVTTVATPSITTYQADPHVNASANNEYIAGKDIYVMVMDDGTPKNDLNGVADPAKKDPAILYSLSVNATEAEVMDALNMYTEIDGSGNVTGLNKLVLTKSASIDNTITAIPGADGNDITVTQYTASKLTALAAGTYAYVYTITQKSGTDITGYKPITVTAGTTDVKGYYTYNSSTGTYNEINATTTAVAGTTYYASYTQTNQKYAVKVIKVVTGS